MCVSYVGVCGVCVAYCVSVRVSVVSLCAPKHVLTKGCLGLVCVCVVGVGVCRRVCACVCVCVSVCVV